MNNEENESSRSKAENPLCPLHQSLEDRDRLEVEYGNRCVACSLNERIELLTLLVELEPAEGRTDSVGFLREVIDRFKEQQQLCRMSFQQFEFQLGKRQRGWDLAFLMERLLAVTRATASSVSDAPLSTDTPARSVLHESESPESFSPVGTEVETKAELEEQNDSVKAGKDLAGVTTESPRLAYKSCYIAGPMTGYPDLNYSAFAEASRILRERGFGVVSPAELNPIETAYEDAMRNDIRALIDCNHICMLEGWEKSKGATLEHHIATVMGLTIITLNTPKRDAET